MIRRLLKGAGVWAAVLGVCAALLTAVCALIGQSSIRQSCMEAAEYFSSHERLPLLVQNVSGTRMDNHADEALLNVIYHVDSHRPLYSVAAAPYYSTDGSAPGEDLHASAAQGQPPNSEYARYWHGSQILLRPLLTFTSVEGCRAILFGLLAALNAVLTLKLARMKAWRPLAIYLAALVMVHVWMCLFTLEYVMSFLVMTGACIAVTAAYSRPDTQEKRDRRITALCIASGTLVCFVDFLTTETLTFTVPVLLAMMLHVHIGGQRRSLRQLAGLLLRWGGAWLAAYAFTFLVKWALVWAVLGPDAFARALSSAAFRMDRAVTTVGGELVGSALGTELPMIFALNIVALLPGVETFTAAGVITAALGALAVLGAVLYLLRGKSTDGALLAAFLAVGALPYARFLAMASHSLDHFFFTYRAQMATLMALMAVMAYGLNPAEATGKKKRRARR